DGHPAPRHGRTRPQPSFESGPRDQRHRDRGRDRVRDERGPAAGLRGRMRRLPDEADRRALAPHGGRELLQQANHSPGGRKQVKILIVDDDPDFCHLTVLGLEKAGIECCAAKTAQEARDRLAGEGARPFDALLLDIELPGTKGWEFLSELRTNGHQIPVVFVTVRRSPEDRVQGLNLGADDYIVKPFDPKELVARLHAVVRRRFPREQVQIQDLTIDPCLRRIERAGKPIDLTPREFDILWALAQSSGRTVSEKELLKRLWGIEFDPETNFVQVHMFRLRKKLERAGKPM